MAEPVSLSAGARRLVDRLHGAGLRPLVVGGALRDAALGRPAKDLDLEVHGARGFEDVAVAVEGIGSVSPQGRSFGILVVRVDGESVEVALPRTGARDTGSDDLVVHALAHRDFTVNSMAWDPVSGQEFDPFGGRADLAARILRPTGPAFAEDPVRVLRGIRFVAEYGFDPAPDFVERSRAIAGAYPGLPVERVWAEWRGIARTGRFISKAVHVFRATGWDRHLPLFAALAATPQDPAWHPEGDALTHSVLAADAAAEAAERDGLAPADRELAVLAALLHDAGKPHTTSRSADGRIISHGHDAAGFRVARRFLLELGAPRDLATRVGVLAREHMVHVGLGDEPTAAAVRRLVRRLGDAGLTIEEWARVVDADRAGRGAGAQPPRGGHWVAAARAVPIRRTPLLRGADLIDLGWSPGPRFASIIRESLDAQDDGEFDDREGALRWLRERIRIGGELSDVD